MPGFTVSAVKGVGVAFSWRPAGGRGFLLARRTSHEVALYWEDLRRASLCRSCEGRSRAGVYRYPSPGLMENGLQACSLHDSPECVSVGCHMQGFDSCCIQLHGHCIFEMCLFLLDWQFHRHSGSTLSNGLFNLDVNIKDITHLFSHPTT
ncbi:uncharacterized protein LOC116968711 isoform X4 [Amblyraja radiata]|uniref:uncharacterized protein LOC116968711 isoform X4 n=1 Tax=Amblyraja radiata TaxID=386614 RepID=UPI00140231B5|nr:uncharacterized protein LOC116968711 isoform X4 [Amblyraja radiata]